MELWSGQVNQTNVVTNFLIDILIVHLQLAFSFYGFCTQLAMMS